MVRKLGLKLKEQKGFTLIELLAVIVILGIIAAIAIPAIGNVINKSEAKSTAQDGVQIINAAKMYMANNDGAVPSGGTKVITTAELKQYLDHVKHDTAFTVTVEEIATSGNFSYTLTGTHDAIPDGETEISEQDLIDAAK